MPKFCRELRQKEKNSSYSLQSIGSQSCIWSWERRMDTVCKLTLLGLCGFLQFCIAQDINCTVVKDAGQTTYTLHNSNVLDVSECDYSWSNSGNLVLANNEQENTTVVRNNTISTLVISTCLNEVKYTRRCVSEGTEYSRTCTFDCRGNALPPNEVVGENHGPYKWIVAVIVALLLVLSGAVILYYKDKILKK